MSPRLWYKYTDEAGRCWRIQATAQLAEIGGLLPTDPHTLKLLPKTIKPRYVWLRESPPPEDRLPARQKVILERDRLRYIWEQQRTWHLSGKDMVCWSYYGEVMEADPS